MSTFAPPTLASPEQLEAANQLIAAGKLKEAAAALNVLANQSPTDPRPYLLGMRLAEAAGNPQGALQAAQRAVQMSPAWSVSVTELALLLARQNQFGPAMEQARKAMQIEPFNPQVLARVIDIAHRCQDFATALDWLDRAEKITPDDIVLKRFVARDLHMLDRHAESLQVWNQALAIAPQDVESLLGRLQLALALGDRERAVKDGEALVALAPGDEVFAYWLAVARGETPPTQPAVLVQALFDGQADIHDLHMVRRLRYQLPKEVAQQILELHPDRKLNVLDLGCGTGLLGVCLGPIQGALIGVDLSKPMVAQAGRHGVYYRVHIVNLLDALRDTPADQYEVITACNVFPYVGALDAAIPDALRVLRPGGHFIFSCEAAGEDQGDLVLKAGQRYAHSQAHVEALCRQAGFAQVSVRATDLFMDRGQPVAGFVVTARKPA